MGFCPKGDSLVSPVVKYILLAGTFLHWVLAVFVIALGAWAYDEKNKYFYKPVEDVYDILFDFAIILMVFGCIMFVITLGGFVGALRENTCLLTFFCISLAVIFLAEVTIGVLIIIFNSRAIETVSEVLKDVYVKDYLYDAEGFMDYFQETFKCCGVEGYMDYMQNEYFACTDDNRSNLRCAVPYSCCQDPDKLSPGLINMECGKAMLHGNTTNQAQEIWTDGCIKNVLHFLETNMPMIGGIAIGIAVPQLVGICLGRIFIGQIEGQRDLLFEEQIRKQAAKDRAAKDRANRMRY